MLSTISCSPEPKSTIITIARHRFFSHFMHMHKLSSKCSKDICFKSWVAKKTWVWSHWTSRTPTCPWNTCRTPSSNEGIRDTLHFLKGLVPGCPEALPPAVPGRPLQVQPPTANRHLSLFPATRRVKLSPTSIFRVRESKWFAQSHTVGEQYGYDLSPCMISILQKPLHCAFRNRTSSKRRSLLSLQVQETRRA